MIVAPSHGQGLLWARLSHVGASLIPVSYLHFIYALLKIEVSRGKQIVLYGVGFIFALMSSTPFIIANVAPKIWFSYYFEPGPCYGLFILHFFGWVLYATWLKLRALRTLTGLHLNQLRYVLLAATLGFVSGSTTFPLVFDLAFPPFGSFVFLYVAIISWAIVRHHLMDINIVITRTAVFLVVYALVLGLPLLGALIWEQQFEQYLGRKWWIWLWVVGVLLTSFAQYVNLYFRRRAEAWLLRDQRRYQTALRTMSQELIGFADVKSLCDFVGRYIGEQMGLASAELLVHRNGLGTPQALGDEFPGGMKEVLERWWSSPSRADTCIFAEELGAKRSDTEIRSIVQAWMRKRGYSLLVPGCLRGEMISCLVLGPKRAREMFTKEDSEVLEALARQSSLVIKNLDLAGEVAKQKRLAQFGQLMNEITHEFGNIFTIIGGTLLQLVERPQDSTMLKASVTSLQEDIRRGQYLTKAAWAYQKKYAAPIQVWPLAQVIQGALTEAQHEQFAASAPQLTITTDVPAEITVEGTTNLHELLLNCLRCVGWACEHQQGALAITAVQNHAQIQVRLLLTGGVDLAAQTSFHPDSVAPQPGRHGGLYFFLASLIVSDHNGRLAIEPQADNQTLLLIELPRQQSQRITTEAAATA